MALSRREFIAVLTLLSLPLPCLAVATSTADDWIRKWMATLQAVNKPLHLGRFADPIYFLLDPIEWLPNQGQNNVEKVVVPKGFVTDFASIPRLFWSILPPDGPYVYAAIIHDYLYWCQTGSREAADNTLRYAMGDFHVSQITITSIYSGVRAGGDAAWMENARLKKNGEKRILRSFPQDPTITWDKWKELNVFAST